MVWRLRWRSHDSDKNRAASGDPAVDTHVDEGQLIAATALRLGAKNRLIVRAIRDGEPFDEHWFRDSLRADMELLAQEREADAERLEAARASARRRLGRPRHFHDYRHADVRPLALREQVDRDLAARLRSLLDDEDFLEEVLSAARESALDEIVGAHQQRQVELGGFSRDERYIEEREDRLASVRRDLEGLQRARNW